MKILLTSLIIFTSTLGFTQTNKNNTIPNNKIDTTKICFPVEVGRQILIDLNDCDRTKEILKLTEKEVTELNKKIVQKDNVIGSLNLKDSLSSVVMVKTEEKFKIVFDENEKLRKDIKNMKTKHTIVESVTAFFAATLVYIIAFK